MKKLDRLANEISRLQAILQDLLMVSQVKQDYHANFSARTILSYLVSKAENSEIRLTQEEFEKTVKDNHAISVNPDPDTKMLVVKSFKNYNEIH